MKRYHTDKKSADKLAALLRDRKKQVRELMDHLLGQQESPYVQFILNDPEGRRRIPIYLDNFEKALRGEMDVWLNDLEQAGYTRATQGFKLEDVWGYTLAFKESMTQIIKEANSRTNNGLETIDMDDLYFLHELIDFSNHIVSSSYIKRRDEIITRHNEQLCEFQVFASDMVSVFEEEKIWSLTEKAVHDIFGLHCTIIVKRYDHDLDYKSLKRSGINFIYLKECIESVIGYNKSLALNSNNEIFHLDTFVDDNYFRMIATPINVYLSNYKHIVFVHDLGTVFKFEKFDRDLFHQVCFYTESVVSNCRMMTEISQRRKELRGLTRRLISIQEDERKRIASDIHDSLTQALTGIGYKALLCQELLEKNSERLDGELSCIVTAINEALRQSRQIISNLRPKILDDMGVSSAFRKMLSDFRENFGIAVNFSCPNEVEIYPEVGIAMFRILQECLSNIKRHSRASLADVAMWVDDGVLTLRISDDGVGFDPFEKNRGLGLISMRERAEDLGGAFTVNSAPGKGCQILIAVPMSGRQNVATSKSVGR